ncbi:penicillin-binding protein activator [Kangiella sp. TOML190]|uniref:penicillin-binding protein activator n=1 Tax=Kangiella sp. TOML190 TaxID=2931351 RepID=UPI00203D0C15|nr:penicillin-binding protein activator [Kangiella sp. TOML190]
MTKKFNSKHLFLGLILALGTLSLSACFATQSRSLGKSDDIYQTGGNSADYYLQQAAQYQGSDKAPWKLRAASAYAKEQQFSNAYNTLISFQATQLPPQQRNAYYLLKGESALRQQKGFEAIRALQSVNQPDRQSRAWNRHYQLLFADALSLNNRNADAAVRRIQAAELIDDPSQLDSQYQQAWQELSQAPLGAIETKLSRAQDHDTIAWLELAQVQKKYQRNARLLSEGLSNWLQQYAGHPAISYLPSDVSQLRTADFSLPRKVALIVPLSGRFATVGGAIRDGFLAGYFESQKSRGELPEIQVYDSASGQTMDQLYQQAMTDGVEMVVGPLLKNNIDQLTRYSDMQLPTLVLNRLASDFSPTNMYQFGLPVEDEAAQIARYAIRKGETRAFVINAEASVGARAVDSFVRTYEDLGGTVVQVADISRNQDPKSAITRLLGVDKTEKRSQELQNLLNVPVESSGQGSSNADAIFLISNAQKARIIKPYLNYYYAYNLPVYATSDIYSGSTNPRLDNDLSGIMFTDAPWVLGSSKDILSAKKSLSKTLPSSHKRLGRFFALGHDAYRIIPELGQLSTVPESAIEGLSGVLSMDSYGRIQRQLAWGRYEKGRVKTYNQR